jgi:hypothetical protein
MKELSKKVSACSMNFVPQPIPEMAHYHSRT